MNFGRKLKRYLVAGFIIVAPISVTIFLLVSFVTMVDYFLSPVTYTLWGRHIPGVGMCTAVLLILVTGFLGSNIIGQHVLDIVEDILLHIPVFNWLYRTIKQLAEVFSPEGKLHFKSVVLIEYPRPGVYSVGFVTNKVVLRRPEGKEEELFCVYVATNHLYIGDIVLVPKGKVIETHMTLQQGLQSYLSAGATIPDRIEQKSPEK